MKKPVADRPACVDLRADAARTGPVFSALVDLLRCYSPEVEPSREEPGIFWLNAAGLGRIYASPREWADSIRAKLEKIGFDAVVIVGFTRFGTYALAKSKKGSVVLKSPEQEYSEVRKVPIGFFGLPSSAVDALAKLKKRNLGELVDLPAHGILERFGKEVHRLRSLAAMESWNPLQPEPPKEPVRGHIDFDGPESNASRLTFFLKGMLRLLLRTAAQRGEAVSGLEIEIILDRKESRIEMIRPAAPTLDEVQLADLMRLRLESMDLSAGAIGITATAVTVAADDEQLSLFAEHPRRDPGAANRALARLRAEFGKETVMRAVLKEGHLPEACFAFEPMDGLPRPHPLPLSMYMEKGVRKGLDQIGGEATIGGEASSTRPIVPRTLVRRIYARPIPLQTRPVVGPRGCHLEGMGEAPAARVFGPYIVAGGWWARPVHREYHFAETETGRILWIYFDKKRRSWFIHGEVE